MRKTRIEERGVIMALFKLPKLPKIPTKEERRKSIEQNVRSVVASVATGNVGLQYGCFTTQEDLEKLRAENQKYDFCRSN